MKRTVLAAIVAAGLLAGFGCSGGGQVAPSAPQPQQPQRKTAQATLTINIPLASTGSSTKRPAYVSAGTQSITFSGSGITTQTLSLAPLPNANCPAVGGFYQCSLNFAAPVGNSTLTVQTFASTNGTGTPLSRNTIPITVVQDQTNSIPVTLNGVVSTLVLTLSTNTVTAGTAQAVTATLGGKDAAGDTIIGPGAFVDATGAALTPSLQSSDATDFSIGSQSGNSWAIAYNGAAVAAPTITLIAGALPNATQQITVNPAPTSSPGGTNVITNGDFATNAFDGSAGWYRCYATRETTAGMTPINASPAPVNQLAVIAGATSAPAAGPATDVSQVSAVPGNTPPPSGNAHFALVGYATPSPTANPFGAIVQKGNTGICQDIASVPASGSLTMNVFEGGDDNWSKSDSEADLYPAGSFVMTSGVGVSTGVTPVRLFAENNCYDSAQWEAVFLPAPWGTGTVAISSTARWSGCPLVPGGPSPGGYNPSSGGGYWYGKTLDVSSYAGQSKTLFIGISRDAGGSKPTSSGAQYYNYVFVDHVQLIGSGGATPPPLSVAPNPFSATQTGPATLTASETAYSGSLTVSSDNTGVVTVTTPATASGGTATIHVNVVNAGFANITVTDSHNQSVVIPVTVTLTPVTIN